jgi:hypothetical protein
MTNQLGNDLRIRPGICVPSAIRRNSLLLLQFHSTKAIFPTSRRGMSVLVRFASMRSPSGVRNAYWMSDSGLGAAWRPNH